MFPSDLSLWCEYHPHAGQQLFHYSEARFKLLIAGARFGKSLASAREALIEMLCGPTRGWLVAPTFSLAQPEFRFLAEGLRSFGCRRAREGGPHGPSLRLPWGAQARTMSALRPESLLGEELDWAIACEASHLEPDAFERYLRPRLATRIGRMVVPTTPHGRNWIYDLYRRVLEPGQSGWQAFRYATWENPGIAPSEIADARHSLPPEVFAEQYGGEFTGRRGRVYPEFSVQRHVVAELAPPAGAVFFKAVDFGYTNPFVCLWAALDSDGRLGVFDEYRLAGATLDVHAGEIRRRDEALARQGFIAGPCWADPSGRQEREELARHGVPAAAANNGLLAGINAVRERLLARKDGTPGLLVSGRCQGLVGEFETYSYDETLAGREPLPVKQDDHALDALRYLCLALARRVDWRGVKALW